MIVVPSAKAAATASTGYSSIIDGARAGRHLDAAQAAELRTRKSATSSPPSLRTLSRSIAAPISASVVSRPVRSGFIITPSRITSEPGTISAATSGNAAEDGSAGTTIGAGASSGWPVSVMRRPPAPIAARPCTLGAEMGEHLLGMVAGRLALDHGGLARRRQRRRAAPPI